VENKIEAPTPGAFFFAVEIDGIEGSNHGVINDT
jgi:hypothetical protein